MAVATASIARSLVCAWLACAWATTATAATAIERDEGLAYDAKTGALAYRETHWRYRDGGRDARLVLYRCPDGAAFARKTVADTAQVGAPDFAFVDARDGYREGVRSIGGRREVFWQADAASAPRSRALDVGDDAVFDAGFDALVRARWQALHDGGSVSARFLVPSRQDFLPLRVRGPAKPAADGTLPLRLTLDAWYGFAAPEIALVYRGGDHRLLSFRGIGTIRGSNGRHRVVRIEFPERLHGVPADAGELAGARGDALAGRCRT